MYFACVAGLRCPHVVARHPHPRVVECPHGTEVDRRPVGLRHRPADNRVNNQAVNDALLYLP